MKRDFVAVLLVVAGATFTNPTQAAYYRYPGYYQPINGGYNVDTLTNGSRVSPGLTIGTQFIGEPPPSGSIKPGAFRQSGGTHNVEGTLTLEGLVISTGVGGRGHTHFYVPHYRLTGGRLNCDDLTISVASFSQSGGTNHVKGRLALNSTCTYDVVTTFGLSGGRLIASNVVIEWCTRFSQFGGIHVVNNLTVSGSREFGHDYYLGGGKLFVHDISLRSSAVFGHERGLIRHSGTLTLTGSRWLAARGLTQLGVLQLQSSIFPSEIGLSWSAPAALRFADSAHVAWAPDALLIIHNWRTDANGAPRHRIFFGTDEGGLTPEQLAQIRFRNPFSYPPGDYPARIRRGGEVRPAPSP